VKKAGKLDAAPLYASSFARTASVGDRPGEGKEGVLDNAFGRFVNELGAILVVRYVLRRKRVIQRHQEG